MYSKRLMLKDAVRVFLSPRVSCPEMQVFSISEGLRFAEECRDQEEMARMALDFKAKSVLIMVFATAALLFLPLMLPPLPPPPPVLLLVPVAILATLIFLSLSPGGRLEKEILYACLTL
ncbi:protein AUXIN-REGULATED GENE INVOLVED IN ORGAN SIZE-like [Nymphaea colorata]|uniref:protein AUXIN-REGULATED GENE INVOLVED IN ORGAN SIZE-like n=1 Tax=Nymphaea colorata TaxID=210225 RepID=UPI00129D8971|nr:protein AUXIN-REGULATED GENE INVOLVED IN ORGAN SIZE-like [Nymphaea colorata]